MLRNRVRMVGLVVLMVFMLGGVSYSAESLNKDSDSIVKRFHEEYKECYQKADGNKQEINKCRQEYLTKMKEYIFNSELVKSVEKKSEEIAKSSFMQKVKDTMNVIKEKIKSLISRFK